MGAFLDKPKTEKSIESGGDNGLKYAICNMQGWRVEMEDSHKVVLKLPGCLSSWSYFGVFDGHAGANVSKECADGLLTSILETDIFKQLIASKEKHSDIEAIKQGIITGFLAFDQKIIDENDKEKSGSTAIVAFVGDSHIYFSNCGDSRAMLVRNSEVEFATEDHKPCNEPERRRIAKAGGHVILSRVNGSLAVSRSLGDFEYKQLKSSPASEQLVSPEPEVVAVKRRKDADQLMILACDGVWDTFTNDELCKYVVHRLRCNVPIISLTSEVLDTSLFKGSKDNMTILIVGMEKLPLEDKEISRLDKELDSNIKDIVEKTIDFAKQRGDSITSSVVASQVQSKSFSNYPPGGFVTKRAFVEHLCVPLLPGEDCILTKTE